MLRPNLYHVSPLATASPSVAGSLFSLALFPLTAPFLPLAASCSPIDTSCPPLDLEVSLLHYELYTYM